jgi:hypothetical protein
MRRWLAAIAALCAAAVLCFFLFFRNPGQTPSNEEKAREPVAFSSNSPPRPQTALPATQSTNVPLETATPPVASVVATSPAGARTEPANWPRSGPLGLAPDIVLRNARAAVRQYGSMFHGNPVGTNPEITSALNGNNPRQVTFINAESGLQINDKGEMVDPWGTPLFFHQLSANEMEIRSAGPDKIMWTADDLVAR